MFERILHRIWELVLQRRYVVRLHAYDEMSADEFTVWDVEAALLNGDVVEQQRDRVTSEKKYRLEGNAMDERQMAVVVKFGPTGKLIIITVYAL